MDRARTNWAGNVTFRAGQVHRPTSVGQLQRRVAGCRRVRALGTGHSFNDLPDSPGDQVSLAGLPRTTDLDTAGARVRVGGGVRYAELARHLHRAGFALTNLGSLPHISVAGSCATGTHGSGDANQCLAAAVSSMDLVTAEGDLVTLDRGTLGPRFDGAVVSLGCLGVVTALTLQAVPAFDVCQHVFEDLPAEALEDHFPDIVSAGYSVSLFTDWRSSRINQVWVKCRASEAQPEPAGGTWYGTTRATGPRHPVPGMPAEHCTEQLGTPGPWHERLPHFRTEFTPSSGNELQSEFLLPRDRAVDALRALREVRHRLAPAVQVCEVRTVAADQLWLSPCHGRDTAAIHVTWTDDIAAVRPALALVEERLATFDARPHWGKLFTTPPAVLESLYPRLADFRKLAGDYDPAGKFRNSFVDRHVFGH